MRRWILSLATALVVLVAVPAGQGGAATPRCSFAHTRTLLENRFGRVYTIADRDGFRRKFDTLVCSKVNGKVLPLDSPYLEDYAFLLPAIALRGPLVAFADQSGCTGDGDCDAAVRAYDMRYLSSQRDLRNGSPAGPRGHRLVKVGSVRVTSTATLIWISCPERNRDHLTGSQLPNCTRPGDRDRVYMVAVPRNAKLTLLDRGTTIDPRSLRVSRHRATWRDGAVLKRAVLP